MKTKKMSAKEFAEKIEKKGIVDYRNDKYEVIERNRSPFDWIAHGGPEVYEWVKLKIECGVSDLTKDEYNEWMIWFYQESGFFKTKSREWAIQEATKDKMLL